jgi:hypothetical protein
MHPVIHSILAAGPLQPRPFNLNPAVSPWILFVGAVIAAVAVLYLYAAQQKIAGRGVVAVLLAIRIALVLLVIAMLLGPVRQWGYTRHSSGTLFVLLDQSQSMRQKDPQSTDAEQLAWADALGYLPADLHRSPASVCLNQLVAMRDDLDHFRADSDHLLGHADDSRQREQLAANLAGWQKQLNSVATLLSADVQVKQLAADVPGSLLFAADAVAKSIVMIQADSASHRPAHIWPKIVGAILAIFTITFCVIRQKGFSRAVRHTLPAVYMALALVAISLGTWAAIQWPELASQGGQTIEVATISDKADLPWQLLHDMLGKAIVQISPLAISADKAFLTAHGNDARVKNALGKVRQMDRAQLAYAALTANSSRNLTSLAESMDREEVKLVPFGDHNTINSPEKKEIAASVHEALQNENDQNTDIASALKFVSEQVGEDSTVIVVSDGRQNIGGEPEAPAKALAARGTRVFTLMLGSRQLACDAAVDHVDAPDWVYSEDQVIISPVINLDGLKDQNVTVELHRGDEVVDTRQIKAATNQDKIRLRLTDHPSKEGVYDYSVVIPPVPDEAVADNNRQSVRIAVKKDRLNILLVEDDPGWEYQFLRNYLARDHRVKLQVVLMNPAHIEQVQSPQGVMASPTNAEGKIDAQLLPSTRQQWAAFDIVILGDVSPEKIPAEQQANLTAALKDGSIKALLLLAGPRNMPMRYAASPLAEAIPVELSGSRWTPDQLVDQMRHGFVPVLAPDGLNSVLGQFSEDFGTNAALWANMPLWYWHSEQTAAKPGASVIWSIQDALAIDASKPPKDSAEEYETTREHALLATMNVGLGRAMYLASPQTWRLRYVQTPGSDSHIEDVHRRFWGQVVRWAAGNDLAAGGKFVKFGTNKHSYIGGESIVVTARVLNEDFSPSQNDSFTMVAIAKDGSRAGEATMVPAPSEGAGIYRGSMTLPAGSYTLSLNGGQAGRLLAADTTVDPAQKTLNIEVAPNAMVEDRNVNADPEKMAAIAAAGSGVAMDGAYFDVLAAHLPVVDRTETQVTRAGLFSDPNDRRTQLVHWAFFAFFILLITTEWILRKRYGLV